jgi:hypothetical protein
MPTKCDYKISENALQISAPRGLDLLPGRMIRKMIKNIETKYQICEFSQARGRREAEVMDDVIGNIYLKGGMGAWLMGNAPIAVFQRLHASMYDPDFIHLEEDEVMDFQSRLAEDEPFNYEDFTLSMPADYFLMVAPSSIKMIDVISHLRPETFDDVLNAAARIAVASIIIYDEADMRVEFTDDNFPALLTEGLEDWINPPVQVDYLDF